MIQKNPKISVVIPACDRPHFLEKAVKSVLMQSFQAEEIIIIDNSKSQNTNIFENKKIKYIRALPRFGVAQARNMGTCLAKSEYVAFLDDDDIWDREYLKEVKSIIEKSKASIILGSIKKLEDGKVMLSKSQPINKIYNFKRELLRRNPGVIGSNTVIKKDVIFKSSGYDPFLTTGEDKAMVLDLILSGIENVVRAEKAYVYYRTVINGERQTAGYKWAQGKKRFLQKYRKEMMFNDYMKNLIEYFLLRFSLLNLSIKIKKKIKQ